MQSISLQRFFYTPGAVIPFYSRGKAQSGCPSPDKKLDFWQVFNSLPCFFIPKMWPSEGLNQMLQVEFFIKVCKVKVTLKA